MPEELETLVRKTTAIDLGSTNSQMAQIYEISQDMGATWTKHDGILGKTYLFKDENLKENFETVILRKCDLSEIQSQQISFNGNSVFGSEAIRIADSLYGDVKLTSEFKKDFFCSAEKHLSDEEKHHKYESAAENIKAYLKFLRQRETERQSETFTEERLILTVPVRATSAEREKMRTLAMEAGWKNVIIKDEATSVLNYFLSMQNTNLRTILQSKTVHEHITILIMDIGGSTTDLLLAQIKPDGCGGYLVDVVGEWPDIGEEHTLGGIDIDKKLCSWFLDNKYLHEYAVEKRINLVGYKDFREFKDSYLAHCLDKDLVVDQLIGDISKLEEYGSKRNKQYSEKDYKEASRKIGREIFLQEIAAEYLIGLKNAVRSLLRKNNVLETDIEFICLVGGGSQLYGIKDMLQGKLIEDDDPLLLPEIQKDINRVLTSEKPSAVCALGNAASLNEITYKHHCPYEWWLELNIYTAPTNDASGFDKEYVFKPNLPNTFRQIFSKQFLLAKENEALPINIPQEFISGDGELEHGNDGNTMVYMISLFSRVYPIKGHSDYQDYIQAVWTSNACRSMGRLAGEAIAKGLTKVEQTILRIKNKAPDTRPYVYQNIVPWHYQISVSMDENRMIKIQPSIKVKSYVLLDSRTKMTNG